MSVIKKQTIIILVLIGIVFSFSMSVARITGSNGLDSFYNAGKVLDVPQSASYAFMAEGGYSDIDRNWFIEKDNFVKWVNFGKRQSAYNYLYVEVADLESEMEWTIDYGDLTKDEPRFLVAEKHILKNGMNRLGIPDVKFSVLGVRILNQQGITFKVKMMQMREKPIIENFAMRVVKNVAFFGAIYCVVVYAVLYLVKKMKWKFNIDKPITMLQWCYIKLGDVALKIIKTVPGRLQGILTSGLWLILIIYFNLSSNRVITGLITKQRTMISSVILLCIAIFSLRKKLKYMKWNTTLVKVWLTFSAMLIISDILVKKVFMYQGIVMILVFGFLIFVWNNMEHPSEMVKRFIMAVHIYFVGITLFCILCRPDVFVRYMGTFTHPVTFGTYTAIVVVVALVCLDNIVDKRKFSRTAFFYVVEFFVGMVLLWRTQTRGALLPVVLVICAILGKHVVDWKRRGRNKVLLQTLFIILILSTPITWSIGWCLDNLPQKMGTQVTFPTDKYQDVSKIETVAPVISNAKEPYVVQRMSTRGESSSNVRKADVQVQNDTFTILTAIQPKATTVSRIWDKFTSGSLENFTSGRTLFWKSYLKGMNLIGHYNYAEVMGKEQHAHSALFMIPYRYGVFSIIPYILMLVLVLRGSFGYLRDSLHRQNEEYTLFPLAITLVFLSTALLDVTEYLYSGLIWVTFYWVMGFFFMKKE